MERLALHPRSYDKSGALQMAEVPLIAHRGGLSEAQFIVHHYDQPEVADQETLVVTSLDGTSRSIDIETIKSLPTREVTAVLECAGNGRGFLAQRAPGNQFGLGLFHQAKWRGVSVRDILRDDDISQQDWTTLVVQSSDEGVAMPENVHAQFGKGLVRSKALHPDTILAWQVNGQDLPRNHGAPVRLVVPGWYGIWWAKWVKSLALTDRPYKEFWQHERYTYQTADGTIIAPVTEHLPRAVIVAPESNDEVFDDTEVSILAWAGETPVAAVELTVDDGASWTSATVVEAAPTPFAWGRYRAAISTGLPRGRRRLAVRATDINGRTQSWQPAMNRLGYGNNGIHTIEIELLPSRPAEA
ncbi:molybdenum-dependent oxidoreductase-like protein [Antricoccus suffuscus]|uniref:Molybdenum-dependent oxidoreductase-like protein n=1 Tax=Antricoccus suffuscus TaxID=1629062 RepID=A0A2T0ZXP9_9ACTN|nr:molybdopterin-dependent oxidoreductase [Antricoccus suffuscus]PRZ40848.1 molybdenum-dependent oxidoreductase-like protein [Antricoccus suffuscus]